MKKILAILLTVLLVLPTAAQAAAPAAAIQAQSKAQSVIEEAAKMTFPTDGSDVRMLCPTCGETVTWKAWGPDLPINTMANRYLNNRHIYLVASMLGTEISDQKTNTDGFVFRTARANKHSVIHLNGKTIKGPQGGLSCYVGSLDIIGNGKVWGGRNNDIYGGNLDVREGGTLNIYGGTYYKTSPQPLLQITDKGSTVNLYGGTLQGDDYKPNGTVAVEQEGSFFLYGGTVKNGYMSTEGGVLLVEEKATAAIYGGTLQGGQDSAGGNIYVIGELEIYGGEISGAVESELGSITVIGGKLDSVLLGDGITVRGGSFSTDVSSFLPEGVKLQQQDGWYHVEPPKEQSLPWLWLGLGGAAVLAAVLIPVGIASAKKKKQAQ